MRRLETLDTGHRHSTEWPNLASHVSRSGGPGIVSLSVVFCPVILLLILLFFFTVTQEGDQNSRSVILLYYLIELKCIEQRTNSS
jgi:hypothetical protein